MANVVNFFFQAEDGIRDGRVTGVQTCALPIYRDREASTLAPVPPRHGDFAHRARSAGVSRPLRLPSLGLGGRGKADAVELDRVVLEDPGPVRGRQVAEDPREVLPGPWVQARRVGDVGL